jgi:tetratricopeptide (TPR) repeat protein
MRITIAATCLLITVSVLPPAAQSQLQNPASQPGANLRAKKLPPLNLDSFVSQGRFSEFDEAERGTLEDIFAHNDQACGTNQLMQTIQCYKDLKVARNLASCNCYRAAILYFDRAETAAPFYLPIKKERAACFDKLDDTVLQLSGWQRPVLADSQHFEPWGDSSNTAIAYIPQPTHLKTWNTGDKDYAIAQELSQKGSYVQALALLNKAVSRNPEAGKLRYGRGKLLLRLGRFKQASLDMEEVVRQNPNYATPHAALALSYCKTGRLLEAANQASTAIKINPYSPELYALRAGIYASLSNKDMQSSDLQMVKELQNAPADPYYVEDLLSL